MSSTGAGAGGISLKLLVDMKRRKVVFAEANKIFIDFLFQANDVRLAKKFYTCVGTGAASKCISKTVAYDPKALCLCGHPMSKEVAFVARNLKSRPVGVGGGFEEGMPTYIITDDLEVKPMSVTSTIKIFKDLDVKDVSEIEQPVVWLNPEEISKLHASSLDRKGGVLTKMFFP